MQLPVVEIDTTMSHLAGGSVRPTCSLREPVSCTRTRAAPPSSNAPAFLSGQGTSIAIAGAYVLASELVQHDRPEPAFAAYEHRLRDYVEKNQNLALRTDSNPSSLGLDIRTVTRSEPATVVGRH
ncbi:hypothetical protein [Mycobacterium malmoense]|uniref:FAD-binding domain-containing protein n=2 Tax=Mycobacterium malmoense TaxID=1780 RepID=A0ABX3SKA0_MYCMA|nr:hypothetical protein [Mycobacterium malmoense]ORA77302.1 hypothetical protein BST29_23695 [Mycobacterium malmoense]